MWHLLLGFIWWTYWGVIQGIAPQLWQGGARTNRIFCKKKKNLKKQNIKWLLLIKIRHLKLMNLLLFYIWQDARVWAYWNHCFHMYLDCRPSILFFSILNLRGAQLGDIFSGSWLDGCNILCLLRWLVTFLVSFLFELMYMVSCKCPLVSPRCF